MTPPINIQPAAVADMPDLLTVMREFYQEHHLAFDPSRTPAALMELLTSPSLGGAFLMITTGDSAKVDDASEGAGRPHLAGYFLLNNAFSVEFGGRFLLLDELYVRANYRARGCGGAALDWVREWAKGRAAAVRLEVEIENHRAISLYRRRGFAVHDGRRLMTLALPEKLGSF